MLGFVIARLRYLNAWQAALGPRGRSRAGARGRSSKQPESLSEKHRGDVHLQLVEQPGPRHCGDDRALRPRPRRRGRRPPRPACATAVSTPSVTNAKDVPPCLTRGSRGWCVTTKTGTWNGGSSPHHASRFGSLSHGPEPPLKILRPITTAPARAQGLLDHRAVRAGLPPSRPCACAPGRKPERPLVELHPACAERILERRAGPGHESVERHRDVGEHLRHGAEATPSCFVLAPDGITRIDRGESIDDCSARLR